MERQPVKRDAGSEAAWQHAHGHRGDQRGEELHRSDHPNWALVQPASAISVGPIVFMPIIACLARQAKGGLPAKAAISFR